MRTGVVLDCAGLKTLGIKVGFKSLGFKVISSGSLLSPLLISFGIASTVYTRQTCSVARHFANIVL